MMSDTLTLLQKRIEAACQRAGRHPREVTLIGASKTQLSGRLEEFHALGLRDFGENYIQEGVQKVRNFQDDRVQATWHFIGALQSNKAREAVAHFELIHSLDRTSLARELDKEARKIGKKQRVLVQVNVANETSKAGIKPGQLEAFLRDVSPLENLRVEGLMSLPPFLEDVEAMRTWHRELRAMAVKSELSLLSMGMSHDFEVAIEEGATHVRLGTALFGARS